MLSVILHHAQFVLFGREWFQGGFVGVDVFFVISGYLITRILIKQQMEHGSIEFLKFYERRARRILPALFAVMIVSLPLAIRYLLPSDFLEYSKSVLSAIFFGSNFFFYYAGIAYESGDALLKPFLHTWSLGIEEQFYILFPALLFLLNRHFWKHQLLFLLAALLLSFLVAVTISGRDVDHAFYWPTSRVWELLVGSVLAYVECHRGRVKNSLLIQILPSLGLILVLFSAVAFDAETIHPGFATLVPVLGTGLFIAFSLGEDPASRLLSTKPFVAIGLISYSLYLWHFPVFAFLRINGEMISNLDKLTGVGLATVLSVMTYFIVECPFRNHKTVSTRRTIAILVVVMFSLISIQLLVIKSDGYPDRFSKVEGLLNFERDNEKLRTEAGELAVAKRKTGFESEVKKALVVGNSHAMDTFNTFYQNKELFSGYDYYWQAFKLSCLDEGNVDNSEQVQSFYNSRRYKESDVVLISTRYNHIKCNESSDTDGLPYLIQRAQRDEKGVIVFGNTTEFSHINRKIIADHHFYAAEEDTRLSKILIDQNHYRQFSEIINREYFAKKQRHESLNQEIEKIAKQHGVAFFDKHNFLCSEKDQICFGLTPNGYKSFYDYGHYTLQGAKYFGERMFELGMFDLLKHVTPE